jgi:hypothetical protein
MAYCSPLPPARNVSRNSLGASLEFERSLADTTAESHASVKHTNHIDQLLFASDAGGQRGKLGRANVIREHPERAVGADAKGGPGCPFQLGEEAVKQDRLASGYG